MLPAWLNTLLKNNPLAAPAVRAVRHRRRARDWTHRARVACGKTTITLSTTVGLGDLMIVRQFLRAMEEYFQAHGDPGLGRVNITCGAWLVEFPIERADIQLFWWWSMNNGDTWLDDYLAGINIKPDAVCCLSETTMAMARGKGLAAFYFPLGVGRLFQPLGSARSGVGFAGTRGHKDHEQTLRVLGPFLDRPDFEWVDNLKTPEELSAFYNRKRLVLGMTEMFQEKYGMVNNRVYEVLATDTPFIIHAHRNLNATLGFEFPYQTRSAQETAAIAERILSNPAKQEAIFRGYGERVRREHSWEKRITDLVDYLRKT